MQPPTCSGRSQVRADVSASQALGDALPALCARLRGRFGGVLYRHRIPADDAEDLLQTTLLLAVAKWDNIRDPEAWLIGTLHKRCILYWRTRRSHMECTRPFEEVDRECGVEPAQTRRERFADLGKVWHLLPLTQRKLLVLRFQEGMNPREAAQAVGLAYTSVRKITNRAFERLREALGTAPPSRSACGQRAPRLPAAALAERLRAEGGSGEAWMAAVDAFAAVKPPHLRAQLSRNLAAAGIALGPLRVAELGIEDLAAFRLAVDDKATALRSQIFYSLRAFLLWAGERGDHVLQPDAIREALRVGNTIRREAAGKGATAEWSAAADAFLAASTVTAPTRQQYRCHLFAAGTVLGWRPLAKLTENDLLAFRAALLADGRAAGTHLVALLVVRCFLVWAREQGWISIDREVIRVVLQGWDSRRKGPSAPLGSGRAVPPPASLGEITVPKAARPAIPLERERLVPEMLATPIQVVAPSRGRRLAPKEPSAAPVVQAGGKAGSAHTSRGDPSGRTRRIPDRVPPLPAAAARPIGRARLNGPLAQPRRAARPPRVSALWKAEIEAYLASFASTDHETYRRHLLDAASALAAVDLPQVTVAHLTAYRERLRADGRGQRLHLQALSVLRAFLVWAGARHSHQLGAWEVVAALPLPPIADEDFTRAFVAHFREGLMAGPETQGGRA